jgi:hypothetical protein
MSYTARSLIQTMDAIGGGAGRSRGAPATGGATGARGGGSGWRFIRA